MSDKRHILGQAGEDFAEDYLRSQGYQILEKNYRSHFGEIDIIAQEDETICFVEVRAKTTDWHGHPLESISIHKKRRLIKTAFFYLQSQDSLDQWVRFDVVGLNSKDNGDYEVDLIKNAFELEEVP